MEHCLKCERSVADRGLCTDHLSIAQAFIGRTVSWAMLVEMGQARAKRQLFGFQCVEPNCLAPQHYAKGYCYSHYIKDRRKKYVKKGPDCAKEGCAKPAWLKNSCEGKFYCIEHVEELTAQGKHFEEV